MAGKKNSGKLAILPDNQRCWIEVKVFRV